VRPYRLLFDRVLTRVDAETAHRVGFRALRAGRPLVGHVVRPPAGRVEALGLVFPGPLGLAAGFDKNAEVPGALLKLGFGFVEVGTLTPWPQAGAARPRLFRLSEDAAVINRFGFNNEGFARARARLERRSTDRAGGLLGVNVGANKDADDRVEDYVLGVRTFAPLADYLTINVSSPNTPGLRDLQRREALDDLIARVVGARDETEPRRPLMLKIAPDLDARGLEDIVATALARRIDGLIVSNTTVARPATLVSRNRDESGGLSGRPLFEPSTKLLAQTYLLTRGAMPLIGVGGVEDSRTALAKIEAGANLVQLYTGLALKGPEVVKEILDGLTRTVEERGAKRIGELIGAQASAWAGRELTSAENADAS
jgi:dihydroorotate dehydrogenase